MKAGSFSNRHSEGHGPVYRARKATGISQQAMAQLLGCTRRAINDMEREGREPTRKRIALRWRFIRKWCHHDRAKIMQLLRDYSEQRESRYVVI